VIFGGGREKFLLNNTYDPESGLLTKGRLDKDLIQVNFTTLSLNLFDFTIGSL